MPIFKLKSARKRRNKLLSETNKSKSPKERYHQAYSRCLYIEKNSRNPIYRIRAKSDADYFRRKLKKYK